MAKGEHERVASGHEGVIREHRGAQREQKDKGGEAWISRCVGLGSGKLFIYVYI